MSSPSHTIVQISDIHLVPNGLLYGLVDTAGLLRRAVAAVDAGGCRPDALVLSGDLTDSGDADAYDLLLEIVEPAAGRWGAEVVYIPGNHDHLTVASNDLFQAKLLGRPSGAGPADQVRWIGDLRVIALDSTEQGCHDGELRAGQLGWLREQLSRRAGRGTVLALHHPPVPSPIPAVEKIALRRREQLADVVAGTDVRLILSGHAHHAGAGSIAGVPVWVAPAVAYDTDVLAAPEVHRGVAGGGFTRVDVFEDSVVATFIPLVVGRPLYEEPLEQVGRTVELESVV